MAHLIFHTIDISTPFAKILSRIVGKKAEMRASPAPQTKRNGLTFLQNLLV